MSLRSNALRSSPEVSDERRRAEADRARRVYEYRIDLGPLGVRIPAGYRLRLDVASSDFPHRDRNLNTGGLLGREGPEVAFVATQTVINGSGCDVDAPVLTACVHRTVHGAAGDQPDDAGMSEYAASGDPGPPTRVSG